jgi:hypothetical protein
MKKFFGMRIVFVFAVCFTTLVWGQQERASRSALKSDLVGSWEMVSVQPIRDKSDPVFFPHQRFVFNPNSSMKFMSSDRPFSKEWLDKFQTQDAEIDYSLNEKGVLTLSWQKKPYTESALCSYVLKDVPAEVLLKLPPERQKGLPRKGNVTLSYLDKSGRIAYQKVLFKIA